MLPLAVTLALKQVRPFSLFLPSFFPVSPFLFPCFSHPSSLFLPSFFPVSPFLRALPTLLPHSGLSTSGRRRS
jgi:hypothetical protein